MQSLLLDIEGVLSRMKNTVPWYSIFVFLEVIALEIGVYAYAALKRQERLHVLILTVSLCLLGGLVGAIVTHSKKQAISFAVIVCGIASLVIGIYFRTSLDYHERAIFTLGVGILCIIGGIARFVIDRSRIAALSGVAGLGIVALSAGIYFLMALKHQYVAYMILGTGILCLLGGLAGIVIGRSKAQASS